MKIWFDVLTPKQILFFEPMIKHLGKNNKILCTSRNYREVTKLANLRKMKVVFVGKHGGKNKTDKLHASLNRTAALTKQIQKFKPDVTVSFCSPEASRVSFGLGIRHIAFCDSPHAEAVMRLCVPFVQKLLIPWIIPKKEFSKYGIREKDIITYKAIDASIIVRGDDNKNLRKKDPKKNILIRMEEEQAAYVKKNRSQILPIIKEIARRFPNERISVLPRYYSQINLLKRNFGTRIKVLDKVVVGKTLLQNTDVFIGSGGTMTAEAALLGIPTISYDAVPNLVQDYLVRKKLVILESDPNKIAFLVGKLLNANSKKLRDNAKRTLASMEDPTKKLVQLIKMQ